jgi:hypothetical protein
MRRRAVWLALPAIAALLVVAASRAPRGAGAPSTWEGVDEAVVRRVAEAAGQHDTGPLFDALQGDLLLFAFLWAGLLSGFALGYLARALFVERLDASPGEGRARAD